MQSYPTNIHQALLGIAQIRQQIDSAESYRGFRSATTAFSGACVILSGSLLQTGFVASIFPQADDTTLFLAGWIAIASVSVLAACIETFIRAQRDDSGLVRRMHRDVILQIVPELVVRVALTWLLVLRIL